MLAPRGSHVVALAPASVSFVRALLRWRATDRRPARGSAGMIVRMPRALWSRVVVASVLGAGVVGAATPPEPPPALSEKAESFSVSWEDVAPGLSLAEQRAVRPVFEQLAGQAVPAVGDVETLERLVGERTKHRALRELAEVALVQLARAQVAALDYEGALEYLRRAVDLAPGRFGARLMRIDLLLRRAEWGQAEHDARDVLARDDGNEMAALGLAYALLRQDRDREALEALAAVPRLAANPAARRLYERLRENLAAEERLREQRMWRFSLRYDGEQHEALGESVLRLLDEQYANLAAAFLHTPSEPIPVVLLSRAVYASATRAPGWSGGLYSSFDGRIRVPTAGLSPASALELEGPLTHELTHAFVDSLSGGRAEWELQEGLAQYFEGQRAAVLSSEPEQETAEGEEAGVHRRYAAALGWVEYLMGQGGQAALNTLLRTLARTGDPADSYREAFGRDLAELREGWRSSRQ